MASVVVYKVVALVGNKPDGKPIWSNVGNVAWQEENKKLTLWVDPHAMSNALAKCKKVGAQGHIPMTIAPTDNVAAFLNAQVPGGYPRVPTPIPQAQQPPGGVPVVEHRYNEPPIDFDDDIPFAPVGLQYPALLNCS